jgi:pyrroline-5-carboxylate reductase
VGRLAVIGGGQMGGSIVSRVVEQGLLPADHVTVGEPNRELRQSLEARLGVRTTADNAAAIKSATTVLLAVKPQIMTLAMDELRGHLHLDQLVMSIAAGVELRTLEMGLRHAAIIRVMPNTPAQVGMSISAWKATDEVTPAQKAEARAILQAFGREFEVDREQYLDMVTAVSGSGPAWVMLMLEALTDAGVQIGLKREWAYDLALQTFAGSVELARQTGKHPAELRNVVTTPGGTTAAGLYEMERGGLRGVIAAGIVAAYERCVALGEAARKG